MTDSPAFDQERANRHPGFGLFFRRYAPFDTFGFGFEGDKRGPSTSIKASSRTYGCVMFNKAEAFYWFAGSAGTHYHSTVWGEIVGYSDVSMTVELRQNDRAVDFSAATAGANPLVPKSPDIDTKVHCRFDFRTSGEMKVDVQSFGDTFPNLEIFIFCFRSGNAALLIDGRTTGGRNTGPMTRLAGRGAQRYLGRSERTLKLTDQGLLDKNYTTFDTTLNY